MLLPARGHAGQLDRDAVAVRNKPVAGRRVVGGEAGTVEGDSKRAGGHGAASREQGGKTRAPGYHEGSPGESDRMRTHHDVSLQFSLLGHRNPQRDSHVPPLHDPRLPSPPRFRSEGKYLSPAAGHEVPGPEPAS